MATLKDAKNLEIVSYSSVKITFSDQTFFQLEKNLFVIQFVINSFSELHSLFSTVFKFFTFGGDAIDNVFYHFLCPLISFHAQAILSLTLYYQRTGPNIFLLV